MANKKRWLLCAAGAALLAALLLFVLPPRPQAEAPATEEAPGIVIGFSHVERDNPWRTAQVNSFRNLLDAGMSFIYHEPAEFTSAWQVQDVYTLLDEGVDYLVIAPYETAPLAQVLEEAKARGVPVILIERDPEGLPEDSYMSLIAPDYVKEGRLCAAMLAEHFDGTPAVVAEIWGPENSPVAKARSAGFHEELKNHPNLRVVYTGYAGFDRVSAQKAMESILAQSAEGGRGLDAVFSHSDEDGLGVLQALKVAGYKPGEDVAIVSVNGMQDVCKAIVAGEYLGTIESNPRWGQIVLQLVRQRERGYPAAPTTYIPYLIINRDNAEELYPYTY